MRYIILSLFSFFFVVSASAGSHQEFLEKKGMLYDGWQDEGLLKVQKKLPKYRRMTTNELHRRVSDSIAFQQKCQERSMASELAMDDECNKAWAEQ